MLGDLAKIVTEFSRGYTAETTSSVKIIDVYLVYILLTGVIQFVYCALVGTFPFNSFLSGFISTVGSFVLAGMFLYNNYL
jgi:oligosaccharyltransferase complex subunit epsilon